MLNTWLRVFRGVVVIVLLVSSEVRTGLALDDPDLSSDLFYPFGRDVGDAVMTPNDDGSSGSVSIDVGFPFFGSNNAELFVNTNGAISFGLPVSTYTPESFPVLNRLIAPYWCDIDTRKNRGRVYYRQSRDAKLLDRATTDTVESFSARGLYSFKAKWIFIATWHRVTYYGGNMSTPVNSFQAVLITDGRHSIAVFNYGRLTWTTGTSSGGDASTGLGGTAAQAGFNAGDKVNFFAVPGSQTSNILEIATETNSGLAGRWMFQVESAKIQMDSACEDTGKCKAYQRFDEKEQKCEDIAPAFECPTLEGPTVDRRVWVEFHCVIPTNETSGSAIYLVTFLFNGDPVPKVPAIPIRPPQTRATLHEKLLYKLLGKWISCKVQSLWESKSLKSQELTSVNHYFAGLEVSPPVLSVHEGDLKPAIVTVRSTIPVTCSNQQTTTCDHVLRFKTLQNSIVLLQEKDFKCSHTMTEDDWEEKKKKKNGRKAYKMEYQIKLYARVDKVSSRPRPNDLIIEVDAGPKLKNTPEGGGNYPNMWWGYSDYAPVIQVYHHDGPHAVCRVTGDPHITTFDRVFYSVYAREQYTYVQTTRGPPIEIQVRHKYCGPGVSCACAVAAREDDVILIVDKCTDNYPHTVTPNDPSTLPEGASIIVDKTGRSFTINLPNNVKVVGYFRSWGMNIEIQLTPTEFNRTRGLCGTFDNDGSNDLWAKGQARPSTLREVNTFVDSWKVEHKKSLFDGHLSDLSLEGQDSTLHFTTKARSYCICTGNGHGDCGSDKNFENGLGSRVPRDVTNNVLKQARVFGRNMARRRRRNADTDQENYGSVSFDVDWRYNSTAYYDELVGNDSSVVNRSSLTESQAEAYCRRVIWDGRPLKRHCEGRVNASDVNGIIDKCVLDIRLTGDTSWADDKIQEMEDLCLFETLTVNITERNTSLENLTSAIEEMSAVICLPPDCSRHGECRDGNCVCHKGYIGADCASSVDDVPNITDVLSQSSCDVDKFYCEKVEFLAAGVAATEDLTCRVEVTKLDNSTKSMNTNGHLTFPGVAYCDLPTDGFQKGLRSLQRRTRSPPNTSSAEGDGLGFHSLPPGNPALLYSVSISNNRRSYSKRIWISISEWKCYEYNGGTWLRKKDTCLISDYCFTRNETNPFNPDCEFCDPVKSPDKWTKRPGDPLCDPCSTSPCHGNGVCISPFRGIYRCVGSSQSRGFVILSLAISVASVILLVFVVILVIHWRNKMAS